MASAAPSGCPPITDDDTAVYPALAFPPVPPLTVAPSLPVYECNLSGDLCKPFDNVVNFLSTKDVSDNATQLKALSGLTRVRAVLLNGFSTRDSIFTRPFYLRFLLEVVDSIHRGLFLANKNAPARAEYAFAEAVGDEARIGHKIGWVIEDLDDFFEFTSDDSRQRFHCLRCVYSARLPLPENQALLAALNLTVARDSEAYRTSMLNDMVRTVQSEAESWKRDTLTNLKKYLVQALISSTPDLSDAAWELADDLDPDLMAWVISFHADVQDCAKCLIAQEAVTQLFNPMADEVLTSELASMRARVRVEVDRQVDDFHAEYRQGQKLNAQLVIDAEIAHELQEYKSAALTTA